MLENGRRAAVKFTKGGVEAATVKCRESGMDSATLECWKRTVEPATVEPATVEPATVESIAACEIRPKESASENQDSRHAFQSFTCRS